MLNTWCLKSDRKSAPFTATTNKRLCAFAVHFYLIVLSPHRRKWRAICTHDIAECFQQGSAVKIHLIEEVGNSKSWQVSRSGALLCVYNHTFSSLGVITISVDLVWSDFMAMCWTVKKQQKKIFVCLFVSWPVANLKELLTGDSSSTVYILSTTVTFNRLHRNHNSKELWSGEEQPSTEKRYFILTKKVLVKSSFSLRQDHLITLIKDLQYEKKKACVFRRNWQRLLC